MAVEPERISKLTSRGRLCRSWFYSPFHPMDKQTNSFSIRFETNVVQSFIMDFLFVPTMFSTVFFFFE